jgi:Flp pilus assembly protein TadD
MSPSSWSYYHDRVSIYLRTHQYEEALKDCNECVESNPKEWTHYRLRSEVYEAMGKSENARWDYYTSMDLNPVINR